MSSPNPKPTRQQLEELDALLQRMLSLPVNQLESELAGHPAVASAMAAPSPMISPAMGPAPSVMPRPPMPQAPAACPPPQYRRAEPPRGENAWQVPLPPSAGGAGIGVWPMGPDVSTPPIPPSSMRAPAPPMPAARLNVATVPSPDETNRSRDLPPMMPRQHGEMPAQPIIPMPAPLTLPPISEPPLPFYLWPFGLIDHSMGGTLAAFGLPGRWLGQGGGKVLIGWAGFFMLAGAAAWGVMDYLGLSW